MVDVLTMLRLLTTGAARDHFLPLTTVTIIITMWLSYEMTPRTFIENLSVVAIRDEYSELTDLSRRCAK